MGKSDPNYLKAALTKGGKFELNNYFKLVQTNPDAKIFLSLTVPDFKKVNKMTTIDKVVFKANRCFVVEEKSFTTSIRGDISNIQWYGLTDTNFTWFKNPIKQNLYHTTCLTMWLKKNNQKTKDYRYVQLVVVPDSCAIEVPSELMTTVITQSAWEARLREITGNLINTELVQFIRKRRLKTYDKIL